MSRQAFEAKLQQVENLRKTPETAVDPLRKFLRDRNNFVVSKAAAVTGDLHLQLLIPDLLAAYERFFDDPVKTDPQCWAKLAIAKALVALGHTDRAPFVRGIAHIQMEPVYGGRSDSAATLRGSCALALIDCRLDDVTLLTYLADALADPEKTVRLDAALALSRAGIPEAIALLRFKALTGDADAEVLGQCFHSLLQMNPRESIPFVERFFDRDEETKAEAASALAQCPDPTAWEAIQRLWKRLLTPEFRTALRAFLAASPHRDAARELMGDPNSGTIRR